MNLNLLPYFDERKLPIDMLVMHSFACEDFIESCHKHRISVHYIIDEEGSISQYVNEENRAWHAGYSHWRDAADINSKSIGVEVFNATLGDTPFNDKQLKSIINLSKKLIQKYNIPFQNIVAHSDIAPLRKVDPGKFFPWQKLAEAGIGAWYDINDAEKIKEENIERLLNIIGYDTKNIETIKASAYAFCRRFAPQFVNSRDPENIFLENEQNTDFKFMEKEEFLQILKAVTYKYDNLSRTP